MSGHHVHIPQNGCFEPRNKLPAIMNTAEKKKIFEGTQHDPYKAAEIKKKNQKEKKVNRYIANYIKNKACI